MFGFRVGLTTLVAFSAFTVTSASTRPSPNPRLMVDTTPLSGWTLGLKPDEIRAYKTEGLKSTLLWGARSPQGAYAFLTWLDVTSKRDPVTADGLYESIEEEAYGYLAPTKVLKGRGFLPWNEDRGPEVVWVHVEAAGSGWDLVSGRTVPTVRKEVFLPAYLRRGNEVVNWIFVANYRGPVSARQDLEAFDAFWQKLRCPLEGWSPVWEVSRSEMQQRSGDGAQKLAEATSSGPPEKPERGQRLSELLLELARAESSGQADVQLALAAQVAARPLAGLALGRVADQLVAGVLGRYQVEIWEELANGNEDPAQLRALALRLAQAALATEDLAFANVLFAWLEGRGTTLGSLSPEEVQTFLRDLDPCQLRAAGSFFSLENLSAGSREAVREWLQRSGVAVESLEKVARKTKRGTWTLSRNVLAGKGLLLFEGQLGRLEPGKRGGRGSEYEFQRLLGLADASVAGCATRGVVPGHEGRLELTGDIKPASGVPTADRGKGKP